MNRSESRSEYRAKSSAYWRANIALIRNLLLIWAFVSIGCSILFVEALNQIQLGGVPLGFWMAQQGSIYTFVILIFVYAFQMDKLDRRFKDSVKNIDTDSSSTDTN
ncbi:MAG: DUF4212 domain-containing protein [Cyanobacteria bacterium P01_D01_bin.73]